MKKILLSFVSFVALSATAVAADLPKRFVAPAPVAPAIFSWAGFYAGVNAGYSQANAKTDYGYSNVPANGTNNFADYFGSSSENDPYSAGPLNISGLNAVQSALSWGILKDSLGSKTKGGFAGGVQAGYNWQTGAFVYGVEADVDALSNKSSAGFSAAIPDAYVNAGSATSSIKWLATARLRAGYAFDRTLVYATGGLAIGGVKAASASLGYDGSNYDVFSGSTKKVRFGWAAGAGVEHALTDRWTVRGEAIYYNLGKVSYNVAAQDENTVSEGLTVTGRHKFDGFVVRTGLNYKF